MANATQVGTAAGGDDPTAGVDPSVASPLETGARGERTWLPLAAQVVLALLVTAIAVVSGYGFTHGSKALGVLPVVLAAAVALGLLALTRFSGFVLLLLAVRPALDLVKLSASGTGNTSTNTATARGIDPSSIVGVLFLLAALVWLAGRMYSGHTVRWSRLAAAVVAFWVACGVSLVGSLHTQASALEMLRIGSWVVMYVVLEQLITSRAQMMKVIGACYVGLLFPLLYTVYGLVLGHPDSEVKGSYTRLTGPFSQSNIYARYLSFLIVFGIAIYPFVAPRFKKAMAGILALSGIFLLLTLTLTAILGVAAALVVMVVLLRNKKLTIALAVAAVVGLCAVPGVLGRISGFDSSNDTTVGANAATTQNSVAWRLNYWTEVLPLANSNPVTGIGLNSTQYETDAAKQPHNDFVRAYVETGLLGFLAYCAMMVAFVGNARRAIQRHARGTLEHAVGVGALGCAIAFILGSAAANTVSMVVALFSLTAFSAAASFVARTGGTAVTGEAADEASDAGGTATDGVLPAPAGG